MCGHVVLNFAEELMKLNMTSKKTDNRGFTLLEILIVLGILGTIMAMLMGRINDSRNRAKVKEATLNLNTWGEAINMYYNDCGKYPASLESLTQTDAECKSWEPGAYKKLKPKDPWGSDLVYSIEGNSYILKSLGKDKAEGGTGDDSDIEAGSEG
jgi:general secretion pathway protein G